jgi:hypothetical protein
MKPFKIQSIMQLTKVCNAKLSYISIIFNICLFLHSILTQWLFSVYYRIVINILNLCRQIVFTQCYPYRNPWCIINLFKFYTQINNYLISVVSIINNKNTNFKKCISSLNLLYLIIEIILIQIDSYLK